LKVSTGDSYDSHRERFLTIDQFNVGADISHRANGLRLSIPRLGRFPDNHEVGLREDEALLQDQRGTGPLERTV
jgi:hypothetical protein